MGKTMSELNYHIEWLDPAELIPYVQNAKLHDEKNVANIANSIKRYGWQQNLTITKDRVIIIGHGRQLAALQLGVKCPCKVIEDDLTSDDIRELRIADNLTHDGKYDFDLMGAEIDEFGLRFEGFDFDFGEIEEALEEEEEPAGAVVEDDYDEEPPEEPKAKYGDVFMVGRHRLACIDSTNIDDVERLMDGAKADMLLTDPPYNVDYENHESQMMKYRVNKRVTKKTGDGIRNDKMDEEQFIQFLIDALTNADIVMKPGAVFYIWYSDLRAYSFYAALRGTEWKLHENLVWKKNRMTLGRYDYHWQHESALYGWKQGAEHLWASDRKQTSVIECGSSLRNTLHPTMKPIALFDYCIRNNTKGGDIVLDLFTGSGTTLMACEQNGRTAYCAELSPKYIDTIINRYVQFTGKADEVFLLRDGAKIPYSELYADEA